MSPLQFTFLKQSPGRFEFLVLKNRKREMERDFTLCNPSHPPRHFQTSSSVYIYEWPSGRGTPAVPQPLAGHLRTQTHTEHSQQRGAWETRTVQKPAQWDYYFSMVLVPEMMLLKLHFPVNLAISLIKQPGVYWGESNTELERWNIADTLFVLSEETTFQK